MTDETVAVLRRFNRTYTQRIGVLAESYLDSGRPLGPSRVLFEVGQAGGEQGVADLRQRLGLDSGHLSRLLRRLEGEGVVTVEPDRADKRQRTVRLTTAGRAEVRRLERRSQRLAERLVAPLTERQRTELAAAVGTVERLLRAATVEFAVVDPHAPDAQWAMAHYFSELDRRFPKGFDPGDALGEGAASMRRPHGLFLVARSDLAVVGCGGLQRLDPATIEVKRMWVAPEWRGLGLARRLLERLEADAARLSAAQIVLDTNGTLTEAIALYERAGYRAVERYNDNPYAEHWFAKRL